MVRTRRGWPSCPFLLPAPPLAHWLPRHWPRQSPESLFPPRLCPSCAQPGMPPPREAQASWRGVPVPSLGPGIPCSPHKAQPAWSVWHTGLPRPSHAQNPPKTFFVNLKRKFTLSPLACESANLSRCTACPAHTRLTPGMQGRSNQKPTKNRTNQKKEQGGGETFGREAGEHLEGSHTETLAKHQENKRLSNKAKQSYKFYSQGTLPIIFFKPKTSQTTESFRNSWAAGNPRKSQQKKKFIRVISFCLITNGYFPNFL